MWLTGMRSTEVCSLPLDALPGDPGSVEKETVAIKITGKRQKQRAVLLPVRLLRLIDRHIHMERWRLVRSRGESPGSVFVGRAGKPLRTPAINRAFSTNYKRTGLRIWPHLLRHCYACERLAYLQDIGAPNPLKVVQMELGHAHMATTARAAIFTRGGANNPATRRPRLEQLAENAKMVLTIYRNVIYQPPESASVEQRAGPVAEQVEGQGFGLALQHELLLRQLLHPHDYTAASALAAGPGFDQLVDLSPAAQVEVAARCGLRVVKRCQSLPFRLLRVSITLSPEFRSVKEPDMRRPPPLPEGSKEKLAVALKSARTKSQFQLVQCLWLRAALQMNAQQVALALGWTPSGVWRVWSRYLREGEAMFQRPGKGGRRHQNLSIKAEREFLNGLLFQSEPGQRLMDSRFIQQACERMVGHTVSVSAVHRMLKRHGWRPVDRAQIMMPRSWEPGERWVSDEAPAYEGPPPESVRTAGQANRG
jgi:Phage integrase family